ncbi:MAG TPA: hypothetical protein VHJ77_12925 [Vicinamibacterales bacterium]|nr:hypothetical protein [Vicinamibacterales bacterium]
MELRSSLTAGALLLVLSAPAWAQPAKAPANDDCLVCHAEPSTTRGSGQPVVVQPEKYAASVHGPLACVGCHQDLAKVTEFPHPEKLAKVSCAGCHDEATSKYDLGVHARARRADPASPAATCVDCHTAHEIKPAADPTSTTYKLNLAATCARCHADAAVISRRIEAGNVPATFRDSIHGQALEKAGLVVAPSCGDCHRTHDILLKVDRQSPVHRTNVPATCGTCHAGVKQAFGASIHGVALARSMPSAPSCHTCHTAHGIRRTELEGWQLGAVEECGTCHAEALRTYRDTFHGQVQALGFARIAKCADCHTSHDIHPTEDPRSSVSSGKLVATCRQCHPSATENVLGYDPHADKRDPVRSPHVYYTAQFMNVLLAGVFTFFGLHTTLWFWRGFREQKTPAAPKQEAREDDDRGAAE